MTTCADCGAAIADVIYLSLDERRLLCAMCLLRDARRGVRERTSPPDPHQAAEVWILEHLFLQEQDGPC